MTRLNKIFDKVQVTEKTHILIVDYIRTIFADKFRIHNRIAF